MFKVYLLASLNSTVKEWLGLKEVILAIDTAALKVDHDLVPGDADSILVLAHGVVLRQGVGQEVLGVDVHVCLLVNNSQHYQSDLQEIFIVKTKSSP